jgi:transketolase
MIEVVNKPYSYSFKSYASKNKNILCLSGDLTSSCEVDIFRDEYPKQFISMGMAEQNMMSFAGGLAMSGFVPFIHTFGVFAYRRPYDQLLASIAYPCRKVRIMGFLPGITTPAGMTHQAIEDISIFRTIPNMTVIETGDATEVESICNEVDKIEGPVYCRILRGTVPRLFNTPLKIGDIRILNQGNDIMLVTTGICTEEALRARAAIASAGISILHVHIHTLKPFKEKKILDLISNVKFGVITMENHLVNGGLGTIISEIISKHGLSKKLIKLGLNDTFAHGGSKQYLAKYYGFDAYALINSIENFIGQKLNIADKDLETARIEDVHSLSKAEAL